MPRTKLCFEMFGIRQNTEYRRDVIMQTLKEIFEKLRDVFLAILRGY